MGKFLTRSFILVLLGLTVYLYIKVVDLQRANSQLAASVSQVSALRNENARLNTQLAQQVASAQHADASGWLDVAHRHARAAEQAFTRGDFAQAAAESRQASDTLSSAAEQASRRSRAAAISLHDRVASVQTRAREFWHSFGG